MPKDKYEDSNKSIVIDVNFGEIFFIPADMDVYINFAPYKSVDGGYQGQSQSGKIRYRA